MPQKLSLDSIFHNTDQQKATMNNSPVPAISVVSPFYNEAQGLAEFIRQVSAVLDSLNLAEAGGWEFILVNDGSRDESPAIAMALAAADTRIRVVSFSRNFGHEAASTAGLRYARGKAVVLIDADLQDPPSVIPDMYAKWREGYQIVYGVRASRQEETVLKKTTSWLFYRLMRRLANIDIPKDTGDFRLLDRRVVDAFNALPERNRFVRGLLCWTGFKATGVSFLRAPRFAGKSSYNYLKLINLAVDSITSFSTAPLKIATWLGATVATGAVLWILVVLWQYFFWSDYRPAGFTFLYISILLLGGVQIFLIGLVGEYLARTYEEVQRRPIYIVDQLFNFADTPAVGGPNGALLPPTGETAC
ncbi:MAG: glycosyltransferase family 2 protein [Candidatus Methylumidiphilus sp.]